MTPRQRLGATLEHKPTDRLCVDFGAGGLAGIYAVLGAGYLMQSQGMHMLILVIAAIACYAMSLAPITWVIISEIFPNRIRGAAETGNILSLLEDIDALINAGGDDAEAWREIKNLLEQALVETEDMAIETMEF